MKKNIIIAAALLFTGCDRMAMDLAAGSVACNPSEMRSVLSNIQGINNVQKGDHKDHVVSFLGEPNNVSVFAINDGSEREAYFYKVKAVNCRIGYDFDFVYEPVFFADNRVVGKGHNFYKRSIEPKQVYFNASRSSNGFNLFD